jgi:hypothetical protein
MWCGRNRGIAKRLQQALYRSERDAVQLEQAHIGCAEMAVGRRGRQRVEGIFHRLHQGIAVGRCIDHERKPRDRHRAQ